MSRLLDPKILLGIKDLSLAARTTIEGFMSGINRSSVRGEGLEFSQYRSYQPGDDLRQLDWKAYARSDRYYIRESQVETSISVRFLLDASASMLHQDNGYTKFDYAKYLAASLAWLAALQGDAVGLYLLQEADLYALQPKRGYQHMANLYYQLEQASAAGGLSNTMQYKNIFAAAGKKELLVFITDLYENNDELMKILGQLSVTKNEIIVFHLMGNNELNFNFGNYTALQDLETGARVDISSGDKQYKERLAAYLASTRMKMLQQHFFYRLINMRDTVEQALRDFLQQRSKLIF
ncbi:MAG TPA: DUF58 domain-containing protein [Chitinophagaceae bacterium]|nr:DUF58 domain-containing protein [Chitinophagaceae bacterium]